MIDNIKLILPLLKFESDDDFYYLQIMMRKKENELLNSNSRIIKNYYINSQQYLIDRYDEIKQLCTVFNARAGIRLNKRSYRNVAFKTLQNIANTMSNDEYWSVKKSYDRAVGVNHNDNDKKWLLDFDTVSTMEQTVGALLVKLYNIQPIGDKIITSIPSKSGFHVITKPFNVNTLHMLYSEYDNIEIHKDNPTNLFIP